MAARAVLKIEDGARADAPGIARLPTRGQRQITLLDLATDHSRLPRLPDNLAPADPANPYADYVLERLPTFLQRHTLGRDIGEKFEYSNLGSGQGRGHGW